MTRHEAQGAVEANIQSWVDAHQDEIAEYLLELVRYETPTETPEQFDEFFERLSTDLEAVEMNTSRRRGEETGGWLEAWSSENEPLEMQLVIGHADTVWPLGTIEEHPATVDDGVLTGPGALDMKGGLTQLVFALRAINEASRDLPLPIHVLISSDEEIGSPESKPRIIELAKRANRVFVLEPGDGPMGNIKTARKSAGNFTITIEGEAAHAGLDPEKGASAIEELANVIPALHDLSDLDAGVTVNVGQVDAGLRPNVIAPEAKAEVDVRAPTAADAARIEEEIRSLTTSTPGTEISVQGEFARPPMERTPGNRLLWRRVRAIGDRLGFDLEGTTSGGASDGNDASQHAPTIDGIGAVGDGAHQRFEYVSLGDLADRVALLAACLLDDPLPDDPRTELSEAP